MSTFPAPYRVQPIRQHTHTCNSGNSAAADGTLSLLVSVHCVAFVHMRRHIASVEIPERREGSNLSRLAIKDGAKVPFEVVVGACHVPVG